MERPTKVPQLANGAWQYIPHSTYGEDMPEYRQAQLQNLLEDNDEDDFDEFLRDRKHRPWNNFFEQLHPEDVRGSAKRMKRKRNHASESDFTYFNYAYNLPAWIAKAIPEYMPRIPSPRPEIVESLDKDNPYAADFELIHPALKWLPAPVKQPQELIIVDSFIKARFPVLSRDKRPVKSVLSSVPLRNCVPNSLQNHPYPVSQFQHRELSERVPFLPSNFGYTAKFNKIDGELFLFFKRAICDGRTLIVDENTYLQQIMPISEKNDCVKHAVLSLAASYVLDYKRYEFLEKRANFHHKNAVLLLDKELKDPQNFLPGKEEALIAALIIITHTESVSWESVEGIEHKPKWHLATRLAERILEYSDPACKYDSLNNVQFSRARPELANIICLDNVLSDCVYPLDPNSSKCGYLWLRRGTDREQRRIISFTGFSSLLMHYFVRITHLSARRKKFPTSPFIADVGIEIEKILSEFHQWSRLSEGYPNTQALFDSCELVDGKVTTREKVTELIAESYVAAAQIYLHCRLFRRRRNDKLVQGLLHDLLRNIDMQPTSGLLFTAQTPLFSIFIAGIVASRPEHRDIIRNWFIPVCADSRGNVPPTWVAMKQIWEWIDEYDLAHPYDEDKGPDPPDISLDGSDAWWEELVQKISENYGRMNLA